MKVRSIDIQNFKKFEQMSLDLHPRFTLLVGDNGAGKTTILDALAVAAGVWLVDPPDSTLASSGRNISRNDIRLVPRRSGDRVQLFEQKPVSVETCGNIANQDVTWKRQISKNRIRTSNTGAKKALNIIKSHFSAIQSGINTLTPIVAYYGAGRAWLPSRSRSRGSVNASSRSRRWSAFYDCFEERIRLTDLQEWFKREAIAFASSGGQWRSGYHAVKTAVLRCVLDADDIWYDGDREEIVLSIQGTARSFASLSAGYRMMLALMADIAIKAVTQNSHLLPEAEMRSDDEELPDVLRLTPGLILIDEFDAHLHPKWQRRVVGDLKDTFPAIQFVCTSHSPFVIQSLEPGELRILDETDVDSNEEYANRPIEDIAEDIQHIRLPQQSKRAEELSRATERYYELLHDSSVGDDAPELKEAELQYRRAAERYSANPGLDSILKLEAMSRSIGKAE